jgi:hypothetical protein
VFENIRLSSFATCDINMIKFVLNQMHNMDVYQTFSFNTSLHFTTENNILKLFRYLIYVLHPGGDEPSGSSATELVS